MTTYINDGYDIFVEVDGSTPMEDVYTSLQDALDEVWATSDMAPCEHDALATALEDGKIYGGGCDPWYIHCPVGGFPTDTHYTEGN